TFLLELPDTLSQEEVSLTVIAPNNSPLLTQAYPHSALHISSERASAQDSAPLEIMVDPFVAISLPHVDNILPYRLKGRVITKEGQALSGRMVIVYATDQPIDTTPAEELSYKAITDGHTDQLGYFLCPIMRGRYTAAFAQLLGDTSGAQHTISINDGLLVSPLLVITEAIAQAEGDKDADCGCHDEAKKPPRLPDAEELAASASYSDDIGGQCVSFTTPNRSLEEFTFYHVVRTTEPEVKKVRYTAPPLLQLPDLPSYQGNNSYGGESYGDGNSAQGNGAATDTVSVAVSSPQATKSPDGPVFNNAGEATEEPNRNVPGTSEGADGNILANPL
ncbi:MAG: hypothetical protein AAFP93_00750, partial [Bacteroidota bacterium]